MLNKNTYYCILILFISVSICIQCENPKNSEIFKNFAIKDTASISKFRISNTEGDEILITRDNSSRTWMIAGSDFKASQPSVNLLMETFYRIRVKQEVPKSAFNTVINRLSVRHKKVDIFLDGDLPYKSWYIGSPTQDHTGTYMLLELDDEKGGKPYITYKPGMYGTLDVRFFTDWKAWRSPRIFSYKNPKSVQKITTNFYQNHNETYTISNSNNNVVLLNFKNEKIKKYDSSQVKHYLTHFNNISYNKIMFENQNIMDSIFNSDPFISFNLLDVYNQSTYVDFWRIKDENAPNGWDAEYGYIRVNNNNELLRAQYFNWEILFKPLSFFTR
jgi:hypothetical protein